MRNSFKWGWFLIWAILAVPIGRWVQLNAHSFSFITSLGQLTGIIGLVLFAESLILSARIKLFDDLFGGLNQAYIAHHIVGGISLLVLLIHPLAIMYIYSESSIHSAAMLLLPGADWILNFGIASLFSLIGLLVLTYYTNLPYQIWRFTHQFLGVSFAFGALHGIFVESDISRDPFLKYSILVVSLLGILMYFYRTILGRMLVKRYKYTISSVVHRADDIVQISFVPIETETMLFHPGQFVFVSLIGRGMHRETHPFSISSVPTPIGFVLAIKALGDYTKALATVPVGTRALIEGPYGRFSIRKDKDNEMIWVAGGIGITPFLSMAASMKTNTKTDLFYCIPTQKEAVYLQDLTTLSQGIKNLSVHPWLTKTQGHLTIETIRQYSGEIKGKTIFLCGPQSMMHELRGQFIRMGVPDSSIHSEEFAMLG